jgi:hypothetical protein
MKKLVNLRCYAAIGNDDYCDTSIWNHIRYVEVADTNSTEFTLETFEEAFAAVRDNRIRNAETGCTLFRNRPTIEIGWGDFRSKSEMTEKFTVHIMKAYFIRNRQIRLLQLPTNEKAFTRTLYKLVKWMIRESVQRMLNLLQNV